MIRSQSGFIKPHDQTASKQYTLSESHPDRVREFRIGHEVSFVADRDHRGQRALDVRRVMTKSSTTSSSWIPRMSFQEVIQEYIVLSQQLNVRVVAARLKSPAPMETTQSIKVAADRDRARESIPVKMKTPRPRSSTSGWPTREVRREVTPTSLIALGEAASTSGRPLIIHPDPGTPLEQITTTYLSHPKTKAPVTTSARQRSCTSGWPCRKIREITVPPASLRAASH